jgi:hypothetical protein
MTEAVAKMRPRPDRRQGRDDWKLQAAEALHRLGKRA